MRPVLISLTCFSALAAGVFIGRRAASPAASLPSAGSAARPGGTGAPVAPPSAADPITQLKQTSNIRRKTALMLDLISKGQAGNMRELVKAAGNDHHQLRLLSDFALHSDPAGFLTAIAEDAGSLNFRDLVAQDFAKRWGEADFDTAFATSRNLPYPLRRWLGGVVLETRFASDPTAALKLAIANPDLRFGWNNDFKIPATPDNVELVRALPPSMGKFAMIKALSADLPVDQALAMVYEDRHSNPLLGSDRISQAMMEKSPQDVQEWVVANPEHPARYQMARRFGEYLVRTNPAAAVEWATTHLSGPLRTSTLEKAASALQENDPAAADAARDLLPQAFKSSGKP